MSLQIKTGNDTIYYMVNNDLNKKRNKRARVAKEVAEIKKDIRKRTATYIIGGFGLVAGLAWNDAIKSLIEYFFPKDGNSVSAKFIYAVIVTLIVVLIGIYVTNLLDKKKE